MSKTVAGTGSAFTWDLAQGLPLLLADGTNNYIYGPAGMPLQQIPIQTISFVGQGDNADPTGAAGSITVNLSAAPQANDQILLAIDQKAGQNGVPQQAGYVSLGTFPGNGSTASELRLYRKTATGSEGSSIQVNFSATPVHTKAVAAVIYRGVDPTTPIDVIGPAGRVPSNTSVTAPSITTTKPGEQLLMVQSALGPVGTLGATWTPAPGMTMRAQSGPNIPAVAAAISDKTLGAAGATGNQTATLSNSQDLIGIQIALKMPPPPLMYLHLDQLGSTRLLTNTIGDVVGRYTFDAYGNTTAQTGASSTLQYAGQYTDAETGFQYLRARYFDPATGQFMTRDPLEILTREAYGYAGGNSLNVSDPSGMNWLTDRLGDATRTVGGSIIGAARAVGRVVNAALPIVHTAANVVAGAASLCAMFTSATVVGGLTCGSIALGASAVSLGTGSALYAQGRLSRTGLVLDAAGALLSGAGSLFEAGANAARTFGMADEAIAGLRLLQARGAGVCMGIIRSASSAWWTTKSAFWYGASQGMSLMSRSLSGFGFDLSLISGEAE